MFTWVLVTWLACFPLLPFFQEPGKGPSFIKRLVAFLEGKINKPIALANGGEKGLERLLIEYSKELETKKAKTPREIVVLSKLEWVLGRKKKAIDLLDPEKIKGAPWNELLKLGIILGSSWQKKGVKRILRSIDLGPSPGPRELLALSSLLAFSGNNEEAGKKIRSLFPKEGGNRAILEKVKDMEILLANLPVSLERPALLLVYQELKGMNICSDEARKRVSMIKGLGLTRGSPLPARSGLQALGRGKKVLLFLGSRDRDSRKLIREILLHAQPDISPKMILFFLEKPDGDTARKLEGKEIKCIFGKDSWNSWFVYEFGITRVPSAILADGNRIEDFASSLPSMEDYLALPGKAERNKK